jgi:transposase InsO family protein
MGLVDTTFDKSTTLNKMPTLRRAEDWELWKISTSALLKRKGCYVAIGPQAANATEDQRDKAFGYIVEKVHDELLPVVARHEDNPSAILEALRQHLFVDSGANTSALYAEFWSLEHRSSESVDHLFDRVDTLARRLGSQGQRVGDAEKVAAVRKALSREFLPLGAQLDARQALGEVVAYDQVRNAARLFESNFKPLGRSEDGSSTSALAADDSATSKVKCFKCGKPGHYARECKGKQNSGAEKRACFNCGGIGHLKRDCRKGKEKDRAYVGMTRGAPEYVLDTGASAHIVNRKEYLSNAKPTQQEVKGLVSKSRAVAVGEVRGFPGKALYMPDASENLLSIRQLTNNDWEAVFAKDKVTLTEPKGRVLYGIHDAGTMFTVDDTCFVATSENDMELWHRRLGHAGIARLKGACEGYVDTSNWTALPSCDVCIETKATKAKVVRKTTHKDSDAQLAKGERIDVDLIGPMKPSNSGYKWALEVVDRRTRMCWNAPLKAKSDAAKAMASILDKELSPFGRRCERLHADRGGEFTGSEWKMMCQERGIKWTYASTATPSHNGLCERSHRTTEVITSALLADSGLDKKWWAEALAYAAYLHNITPTTGLAGKITPYECWTGEKPRVPELKVFGSRVHFYERGGRFGKKTKRGIYLGPAFDTTGGAIRVYCEETKRVRVTRDVKVVETSIDDLSNSLSNSTMETEEESDSDDDSNDDDEDSSPEHRANAEHMSTDGELSSDDEGIMSGPGELPDVNDRRQQLKRGVQSADVTPTDARHEAAARTRGGTWKRVEEGEPLGYTRRGKRIVTATEITPADQRKQAKKQVGNRQTPYRIRGQGEQRNKNGLGEGAHVAYETVWMACEPEPKRYDEAVKADDAEHWVQSMREELQSLEDQHVWDIVEKPSGVRSVTSKWVYKLKTDENNMPVRHKSRVTARGFTQVPGVDFDSVSAPVVSKESVRIVLALASQRGAHITQFDVKTAHLYAQLEKTVYMEPPEGLLELWGQSMSKEEQLLLKDKKGVLRLNKALYGLKQSARHWYETIRDYLTEVGMQAIKSDPCVFVHHTKAIILVLYVDDGLIVGPSQEDTAWLLERLEEKFDIKRLGVPKHFLGWTVHHDDTSIFIGQKGYVEKLQDSYGAGSKERTTPMLYGMDLSAESSTGNSREFREMVGSLMFASIGTRPDISTATSALSRYMQEPTQLHEKAARGVIGYAAQSSSLGLRYIKAESLCVEVYCDASYAPDEFKRRSRTGWVVLINGTPVAWKSTLQRQIAHSTAEAEYIALSDAGREAMFIKRLLNELGVDLTSPIVMYEDNQVAKLMAEEVATKRSKHVDIRYHHIRELVDRGEIIIEECRTDKMIADMLTKNLTRDPFIRHRDRIMAKGEC